MGTFWEVTRLATTSALHATPTDCFVTVWTQGMRILLRESNTTAFTPITESFEACVAAVGEEQNEDLFCVLVDSPEDLDPLNDYFEHLSRDVYAIEFRTKLGLYVDHLLDDWDSDEADMYRDIGRALALFMKLSKTST